jgi:hypothetical protein
MTIKLLHSYNTNASDTCIQKQNNDKKTYMLSIHAIKFI